MIALGRPLRRRFLLEPGTAFLNHGSFGATPRAVLAAAQRWRVRMEANPDRFLRYVLPGALRAAAAAWRASCTRRNGTWPSSRTPPPA